MTDEGNEGGGKNARVETPEKEFTAKSRPDVDKYWL